MKIIKIIILCICFISTYEAVNAQQSDLLGEVSFKNANNVYVRFTSTENINIGDTLFSVNNGALNPCLVVSNKSSSSCVCVSINECDIQQKDQISFTPKNTDFELTDNQSAEEIIDSTEIIPENDAVEDLEIINSPMFESKFRARVSAATYSSLSPELDDDRHRVMLRFSMNAQNINNSRLSFESYLNYRQNFLQTIPSTNYQTKFFRVYNFAVKYDIDSTMNITLGRKINRKISSIGAIDGLQIEKHFGAFYTGAIAGFRPNISKFDFNSNLFEYGGFLGIASKKSAFRSETTIGFMEQQNSGSIDRRYAFFQHRSTLGRSISLYGASEIDLYSNVNGLATNNLRLTNLYGSIRYKMNRRISLSVSYDNRRRIIYYETFRTEVERILADDEARQGLRLRLNVKPFNYINIGVSAGRRFQNSKQNKSDNLNAYISHSKFPLLNASVSIRANWNRSNFLDSRIASIRINKTLIKKKLQGQMYYRMVQYNYLNSEATAYQSYYGASLYLRLSKTLRFSVAGEMNVKRSENYFNINTKLIQRF